ncbi:hypothetical protein [Pontimicrobium aquaticum]|uniref:Uncharacterized protein n=1 Tax=Pontimicrobium aquaticum TaxID=2565367 RepID=A0A4U0EYZ3_9FLAO|nr:hypothetical protein [Pontimicrobium aquaticum]TJY37267.1 hypothetical protein E5167_04780 [Pontimicrobium aquaticum]
MKKIITLVFAFCLFTSCNKRVVQLPETTNKDITEVVDVSPVYMFYDEETDSVEFNRRNMISATNWLVNIDKRLTLKQILPHLQYLQEKRQGDKKHSFQNYFTCNNTDLKNLSFIEFTDVNYFKSLNTKINNDSEIYIRVYENGIISPFHDMRKGYDSIASLNDYFETHSEKKLVLTFDENLTIQGYINIKSQILSLDQLPIVISNDEFIYN